MKLEDVSDVVKKAIEADGLCRQINNLKNAIGVLRRNEVRISVYGCEELISTRSGYTYSLCPDAAPVFYPLLQAAIESQIAALTRKLDAIQFVDEAIVTVNAPVPQDIPF